MARALAKKPAAHVKRPVTERLARGESTRGARPLQPRSDAEGLVADLSAVGGTLLERWRLLLLVAEYSSAIKEVRGRDTFSCGDGGWRPQIAVGEGQGAAFGGC